MKNNIEKAYKEYKDACFGERSLPDYQDVELERAFFCGIGWLKGILTNSLLDDEEKAMKFLSDISDELSKYLKKVKLTIN